MENIRCNLCGSNNKTLVFESTLENLTSPSGVGAFHCTSTGYGLHHTIVQCTQCGLVYANPRWNKEEIINSYQAVTDPLYVEERDGRVLTFKKHLIPLQKWVGPANKQSLLDVGAYTGIFVEIAQNAGWNAVGVEPSSWAIENARNRGLNMIHGTLATAEIQDQSFYTITMWDVVEHLTDPASEISRAYQILQPGGWLVLHTMNIDSIFARLMNKNWPWLMEMHLYYFSPKTLTKLLENAGFQVKKHETQGRFLRISYLISRLAPYNPTLAKIALTIAQKIRINTWAIPINLGDLFTLYAHKPSKN